jgi:HEAT repeat protein
MVSTADLARLETLTDHAQRNALALALGEARIPGLPEVLTRLIQRPDLRAHRGALVHVLGFYDCSPYLPLLVELIVDGNWECAHEAFEIIDTLEAVDDEDAETALAKARAARPTEDWRAELVDDLLALFD